MTVTYVERTVTAYRPEWKERDASFTVNRIVPRAETVPVKTTVMVPEWIDQKQVVTTVNRVPKQIERPVTRCVTVPVDVTDPCTGCIRTVCRKETITEMVRCTVFECVPVQKEVTIKVCRMRPEEKTIQTTRVICETKLETIVRKERYCVMVPYQRTIKVPVCVPACPPPGPPPHSATSFAPDMIGD
jgi:hypothetical protein